MKDVSAGLQSFHGIHDQIDVIELRADRVKEVSRYSARRPVQDGGELHESDWCMSKSAARASTEDHLLDRVAGDFRIRQWLELSDLSRRRRK